MITPGEKKKEEKKIQETNKQTRIRDLPSGKKYKIPHFFR